MHHGLDADFGLVFLGPVLTHINILLHHVEAGLHELLQIAIFFHQSVHVVRLDFTVSSFVLMNLLVENFAHHHIVCLDLVRVVQGDLKVAKEAADQFSVAMLVRRLGVPIEHGLGELTVDGLLETEVVEVF